jgi:hypothetical protein
LSWRQAGQVQSPGAVRRSEVRDARRGKCSRSVFQIPVHPGLDLAALRSITKAVQAASEGNDQ